MCSDNPSFSPDMEWLAFYSPLDRKLKKIATVGGATVTLTDVLVRPSGISWDVDDTILFQAPEGIMRVSAVGGEPELLLAAFGGKRSSEIHNFCRWECRFVRHVKWPSWRAVTRFRRSKATFPRRGSAICLNRTYRLRRGGCALRRAV